MNHSLFSEGGPYNIRRTGHDAYTMKISLPTDEQGRTARQCPNTECSPGYFKVKNGTGIVDGQEEAFCPYCRNKASPGDFTTPEQERYAKDIVEQEAYRGVEKMLGNALGLGSSGSKRIDGGMFSIDLSMKSSPLPSIRRPFEEEIQRTVACPHCGLDHAVFGIAIWCADCGRDIFLTHVEAELAVISAMLSDVERRRTILGQRVAARDLENCLEDTVSIFEAVLKSLTTRHLRLMGKTDDDIQAFVKKSGMAFQNLDRTAALLLSEFAFDVKSAVPPDIFQKLKTTYEKRHPITHNLGVVDRKYIERGLSAEREGREIRVTANEVKTAMDATYDLVRIIYVQLIPQLPEQNSGN